MKKVIITIQSLLLTITFITTQSAFAHCPIHENCETVFEKQVTTLQSPTGISHPPMKTPKEHAKFWEAKKTEIEKRLNLSAEQKKEIAKIKEAESKKLAPYYKQIQKQEYKLGELFDKERSIRRDTLKKFNEILTEEQRNELEKIKAEAFESLKDFAPPATLFPQAPTPPLEPQAKQLTPVNIETKKRISNNEENQKQNDETQKETTITEENKLLDTKEIKTIEENTQKQKIETQEIAPLKTEKTETQNYQENILQSKETPTPSIKHVPLQLPDRSNIQEHKIDPPTFDKTEKIQDEIILEKKLF